MAETAKTVASGGNSHLLLGAIVLLAALMLYQQLALSQLSASVAAQGQLVSGFSSALTAASAGGSAGGSGKGTGGTDAVAQLAGKVLPTGTPAVYGPELGISYDDPVSGLDILNQYDDLVSGSRGSKRITLSAGTQKRYMAIGTSMACEYCCGADTLILPDGSPACGCAHSGAMRGLAKYLLSKHPEMSDEKILEEVGKWKVLSFPQQMVSKAAVMESKGLSLDYISLASNKYRGIKADSQLDAGGNLPTQVGGC